jgi:hypothetical protein
MPVAFALPSLVASKPELLNVSTMSMPSVSTMSMPRASRRFPIFGAVSGYPAPALGIRVSTLLRY